MSIPRTAVALGLWFAGWLLVEQAKASTRRLEPAALRSLVEQINQAQFGGWFDPDDVLAIIQTESGGRPDIHRAEPQISDASIGLMQILLSTARDRGYNGGPGGLYDPAANVYYGMSQLKWIHDYFSDRLGHAPADYQWIGAYNKGVGAIAEGNNAVAYVAKWRKAREAL